MGAMACSDVRVESPRELGRRPISANRTSPDLASQSNKLSSDLFAMLREKGKAPTRMNKLLAERLKAPHQKASIAEFRQKNSWDSFGELYMTTQSREFDKFIQERSGGKFSLCRKVREFIAAAPSPNLENSPGAANSRAGNKEVLRGSPFFSDLCRNSKAAVTKVADVVTAARVISRIQEEDDSVEVTQDGIDLAYALYAQLEAATDSADIVDRMNTVVSISNGLAGGDQAMIGVLASIAVNSYNVAFTDSKYVLSPTEPLAECLDEFINDPLKDHNEEEAWTACGDEEPIISEMSNPSELTRTRNRAFLTVAFGQRMCERGMVPAGDRQAALSLGKVYMSPLGAPVPPGYTCELIKRGGKLIAAASGLGGAFTGLITGGALAAGKVWAMSVLGGMLGGAILGAAVGVMVGIIAVKLAYNICISVH
jgi:hypothetical protein